MTRGSTASLLRGDPRVRQPEAEHLLDEPLRLTRPLRLEHRVAEPAWLHAAARVSRLVLGQAGKHLEHVAVWTHKADRILDRWLAVMVDRWHALFGQTILQLVQGISS